MTCGAIHLVLDTKHTPCGGNRLRPDHQEFADGVKLAAIAAVSAVLTATLVIGAGRTLLPQAETVAAERLELIPVGLR